MAKWEVLKIANNVVYNITFKKKKRVLTHSQNILSGIQKKKSQEEFATSLYHFLLFLLPFISEDMLSSGCIYQRSYKLLPPGNKRLILLIFYNDSSCSVSTTRHKCDTTKLRPLSQTNKLGNFKPMPFFSILLCEPVQFIAILRQISCCFFMLYLFTIYCVCIFIYKKQVVIYKRRLLQGSMQTLEKLNIPHDLVA